MHERHEQLRQRARRFTVRLLQFADVLPHTVAASTIARQLARCGSSVSANYRGACRARSMAEFIAKLGIVVEESDESEHWLDVLRDTHLASGEELDWLRNEAAELRAIFRASLTTARTNHTRSRS